MIKIKLVSKKLVKPSTPTPENLNNYKLSIMDKLGPPSAFGVLLFYGESKKSPGTFEASLAKTLVQFYPLVGRYNKIHRSMDCNDEGAAFVEAEALDVELKDVIGERNLEQLSSFFPYMNYKLVEESIDPVLSIQMTELKCGGSVIGISVYHKLFDMSSLGTFIAAWSSNSRIGSSSIEPIFDCWKLFPPMNEIINNNIDVTDGVMTPKPIVKMFSFNNDVITSLKSKWGVSRVRAVSAVMVKAFMRLNRVKNDGKSRPFLAVFQGVNLRGRTIPPLPMHSCGNLVIVACKMFTFETEEIGSDKVVADLRDALDKAIADCTGMLSMDENKINDILVKPITEVFHKVSSGEADMFAFTDWTKFGFYEADFGWGKPVWTSIIPFPLMNVIVLMSNKEGDGIETWVHLGKNDMSLFEQDEEIRSLT